MGTQYWSRFDLTVLKAASVMMEVWRHVPWWRGQCCPWKVHRPFAGQMITRRETCQYTQTSLAYRNSALLYSTLYFSQRGLVWINLQTNQYEDITCWIKIANPIMFELDFSLRDIIFSTPPRPAVPPLTHIRSHSISPCGWHTKGSVHHPR